MDVLREIVLPKFDHVRRSGASYMAQCPAHDDSRASLSIGAGKEHPVVFHCHAGCDRDMILDALGFTWDELCKPRENGDRPREEWTPRGPAVAVYDYVDEAGKLLFQVCRTADKQFPQRRPDPTAKSGWAWKLGDTRRVLYRLPKILEAVPNGDVINVVEGEKDVHTLERHGLVATCNPGGAGKWRAEYNEALREADVTIVADKDDAGQAHARQVRDALAGVAAHVRIVEVSAGKDVSDHFAAGRKLHDLVETFTTDDPAKPDLDLDIHEFLATPDAPYDWIFDHLLERGDRLVITGFEGLGKSMLFRQMAVCAAAGIHPFDGYLADPHSVLFIDLENSERQSRRKLRPLSELADRHGRRVPEGGLRLIHRPQGIDVSQDDDAAWLLERVTAHKPDVLFVGPLYRLHTGNINEEPPARRIVAVLDLARTTVDCALVIEAHSGHGEAGKNRGVRPFGSSLFLRWPEFGYGIAPADKPHGKETCLNVHGDERCPDATRVVDVKPWRGARDEREWPKRLAWGRPNEWPWVNPDVGLRI